MGMDRCEECRKEFIDWLDNCPFCGARLHWLPVYTVMWPALFGVLVAGVVAGFWTGVIAAAMRAFR